MHKNNQKTVYKCIAYLQSNQLNSQTRKLRNGNFLDLNNNINHETKETLQLMISPDEFCRNIENMIDDQLSFKFNKVHHSRHYIVPHESIEKKSNLTKEHNNRIIEYENSFNNRNCKFPKWLNKKWHNLKKTKSYNLNYKLDSILINDEKKGIVLNKYTCWHINSRKYNHFQAVVKSLNGW